MPASPPYETRLEATRRRLVETRCGRGRRPVLSLASLGEFLSENTHRFPCALAAILGAAWLACRDRLSAEHIVLPSSRRGPALSPTPRRNRSPGSIAAPGAPVRGRRRPSRPTHRHRLRARPTRARRRRAFGEVSTWRAAVRGRRSPRARCRSSAAISRRRTGSGIDRGVTDPTLVLVESRRATRLVAAGRRGRALVCRVVDPVSFSCCGRRGGLGQRAAAGTTIMCCCISCSES